MNRLALKPLLLTALSLFVAACASTELTIHVDLYGEDPNFTAPMTPERASELIAELSTLSAAAKSGNARRIKLARESVTLYTDVLRTAGIDQPRMNCDAAEPPDPWFAKFCRFEKESNDILKNLTGADGTIQDAQLALVNYIGEYETEYQKARDCLTESIKLDMARDATEDTESQTATTPDSNGCKDYIFQPRNKDLPNLGDEHIIRALPAELRASEFEALSKVANATSAYRSFSGPLRSSYEMTWEQLRTKLNRVLENADEADQEIVRQNYADAIKTLNVGMVKLALESELFPANALEAVTEAIDQENGGLSDSTFQIARELESLRNDLPEDTTSRTALASLVGSSARFFELIDRLQDAGDPSWRIVTDPANEGHWNTKFTKTYFYAEGNASVVVVRDSPMRYRVQNASNDPKALIVGQLVITRAIADAGIAIAGAAAGMSLQTVKNDDGSQSFKFDTGTQAKNVARRRIEAEEANAFRMTAFKTLSEYLANALINLADADEQAIQNQAERLESYLSGYKKMLEKQSK